MSELESILNNLDAARRMAAIDPNEPEFYRTRAGIEVAVTEAKDNVKKYSKEYQTAVLRNGVAIFLSGPVEKVREFCSLVTEIGEAVVVNANEMYERLAVACDRSMGVSREFNSMQISLLQSRVVDISVEAGVIFNRPIRVNDMPTLPTYEDVLGFVRNTIRSQIGDALAAEYLKGSLSREAEKIRYMLNVAPVIVLNAAPEEEVAFGAFFGKGRVSIAISDNDAVDKEYIGKTFQEINKTLKKK